MVSSTSRSSVPWPAVAAVARTELRTRWRSLVVVGLLAGLVAGVVAATATITRRTATAYERLLYSTRASPSWSTRNNAR